MGIFTACPLLKTVLNSAKVKIGIHKLLYACIHISMREILRCEIAGELKGIHI